MKQSKFHDELLWRSMPDGADIARLFLQNRTTIERGELKCEN